MPDENKAKSLDQIKDLARRRPKVLIKISDFKSRAVCIILQVSLKLMKAPHTLKRTDSCIQSIKVALKNELSSKNLAVLVKHFRKRLKEIILANMSTPGIILQMLLRKLLLV